VPVTPVQQEPVAVTGRTDAEILTLTAEAWSQINTVQRFPDLAAGCSAQEPQCSRVALGGIRLLWRASISKSSEQHSHAE